MAKNNKRCKPLKQSKYEVVEVGATEKIMEIGAQVHASANQRWQANVAIEKGFPPLETVRVIHIYIFDCLDVFCLPITDFKCGYY